LEATEKKENKESTVNKMKHERAKTAAKKEMEK
jgi:hypothetical protein